MRELILAGFGFLGVIFGKEGAAPGAGSVDQPAVGGNGGGLLLALAVF